MTIVLSNDLKSKIHVLLNLWESKPTNYYNFY